MFLLSNSRAAGFAYEGKPLQGQYFGAFEGAVLAGVVCHAWNGMMLVQSPGRVAELAREALRLTGRALTGLSGPLEQVQVAARELGITNPQRSEGEVLFTLQRAELTVPPLAEATRSPREDELGLLARWRYDYVVELGLARPGDEARLGADESIRRGFEREELFVLAHEGRIVAMTAFNARIAEVVQVGGVFTPPELRGRGYARAVVAGQLLLANAPRAVLFTGESQVAAQRAYRAIGFREAGSYGLVLR